MYGRLSQATYLRFLLVCTHICLSATSVTDSVSPLLPLSHRQRRLFFFPLLHPQLYFLFLLCRTQCCRLLFLCPASQLPDSMRHLSWLRVLILTHAPLDGFPTAVCALPSLEILNISCCGRHGKPLALPHAIGNLTTLRVLEANSNGLRDLPSSISRLVNLRYLSLQSNCLATVCLLGVFVHYFSSPFARCFPLCVLAFEGHH